MFITVFANAVCRSAGMLSWFAFRILTLLSSNPLPVRLVAQPVDELGKMAGEEILRRIKDRAAEQKQILLSSIYLGVLSRHSQ